MDLRDAIQNIKVAIKRNLGNVAVPVDSEDHKSAKWVPLKLKKGWEAKVEHNNKLIKRLIDACLLLDDFIETDDWYDHPNYDAYVETISDVAWGYFNLVLTKGSLNNYNNLSGYWRLQDTNDKECFFKDTDFIDEYEFEFNSLAQTIVKEWPKD